MSQPFIYQKMSETSSLSTIIGVSVFFCLFAIATPLLLHIITKKYVTSIKYLPEQDKYIASTYTIFLREKKVRIISNIAKKKFCFKSLTMKIKKK